MTFQTVPKVLRSNLEEAWVDGQYENCTLGACKPWQVLYSTHTEKYYVSSYNCIAGGYEEFIGGYSYIGWLGTGDGGLWLNPDNHPPANDPYDLWWGFNDNQMYYIYATFHPGVVWDGVTVSLSGGGSYNAGDSTPIYISIGKDGSQHYMQWGGEGYTYLHSTFAYDGTTWEYKHTLGQASRAPGVGHLTSHSFYSISKAESYVFYEKAVSSKYPIHVWKWNGTAWASAVQVQSSTLATAGVHYRVVGMIRADSSNSKHVVLVLQDGQMIWVDLTDNSASTTAIATGCAVDEWPKCVDPPVYSGSNYIWGYDHTAKFTKVVWTNANWKTPTVTTTSGCGTPTDSRTYDSPPCGEVLTAWDFAYNPTANEARAVSMKVGQYLNQTVLTAANLDLQAVSPTWSAYNLVAHQARQQDWENSGCYLGPRELAFGSDWSGYHPSLVCTLMGVAGDSGVANGAQRNMFLVDFWTVGDPFAVIQKLYLWPGPDITITPLIDGGGKVDVAPVVTVTVTPQVTRGWWWDATYQLLTNSSVISSGILAVAPILTVTITPDHDQIRVMVSVAPEVVVTVTADVFQIIVSQLHVTHPYWGQTLIEDVLTLINAERAGLGILPYKLMTQSMSAAYNDIAQAHAEDMAAIDVFDYADASFPTGRKTWAQLLTYGGATAGAAFIMLHTLDLAYTGIGDTDTNDSYSILNSYTAWTAQELYDYLVAHNHAFITYDFTHAEVYLQIGVAFAPDATYYPTHTMVQWFMAAAVDYTGSGGGGATETTPFTNERWFTSTYPYHGTSWHQEFLVLVNERRDAAGLLPFLDPTLANYLTHTDIAQQHSENMVTARVWAHDNAAFPTGWETVEQRMAQATVLHGSENLLLYNMLDPVYNGATLPTPAVALDFWWNSPPHRANLMANREPQWTSYFGFGFGPGPTIPDYSAYYSWYLSHNMLDLTERIVEMYLGSNYEFHGALIEILPVSYALYTFANVRESHSGVWSVSMEAAHRADYGCRVGAQHEALLQYSVQAGHETDYSGTVRFEVAHGGQWRLWDNLAVIAANTATYSWRALGSNEAQYNSFPTVRFGHDGQYEDAPRVRLALTAGYNEVPRAVAAMEAQYQDALHVRGGFDAPYTSVPRALAALETQYDDALHVRCGFDSPYTNVPRAVAAMASQYEDASHARLSHQAYYQDVPHVQAAFAAVYLPLSTLHTDHSGAYGTLRSVKAVGTDVYSLNARVEQANAAGYVGSYAVRQACEDKYDIKGTNVVRTFSKGFYSIISLSSINVDTVATLTIGGGSVEIADAVVSSSESSPVWEARIRLADVRDYVSINEYDMIVLVLGGESYTLVVTGKSINRSGIAKVDAQLSAKSALTLLGAPYTPPKYSFAYDTPLMASDIVAGLLGAVNWELVDWLVPAGRVKFDNTTPLEAAIRFISSAGGILQSEKDGSITVRSLYPVATDRYDEAAVAHTFTDEADMLSVSEDHEAKEGYNKFRIREGDTSFGDKMEWVVDPTTNAKGTVRVYPSPWRDSFSVYVLDNMTLVQPTGTVTRQEKQMVQFAGGVGGLNFPVVGIDNVEWHSTSLGGLSFTAYGTTLSAAADVNQGYGLATITYQTTAYEYDVSGVLGTSSLMLMEDLGG